MSKVLPEVHHALSLPAGEVGLSKKTVDFCDQHRKAKTRLGHRLVAHTTSILMIQFPPEMDENWVRYGLAKVGTNF